jgi:AcrR family transcriptional regulator
MPNVKRIPARGKILAAATELFFEQGYQGTTIDDVIERSGVSRPTLYTHFSTKEELGIAYIRSQRHDDLISIKDAIRKEKTPQDRYNSIIEHIGQNLTENGFKGCRYFNVIAELREGKNPLVKEARHYVENLREIIRDVVVDLKESNKKYKNMDTHRVTDLYYLLAAGAIMGSQEYQEQWPIDRAIEEIKRLIEK